MSCLLIKLLLIAAVLLLLSACGSRETETGDEAALARVISEGYLMAFNPEMMEPESETALVTRRTLTESHVIVTTPTYLTWRSLHFAPANRPLAELNVERGSRVREGDVLAALEPLDPEEAERLFLRQRNAQIELERFDRDFAANRDTRLVELEHFRELLALAEDNDWQRTALDLARREVTYQQFLLNNEQNRDRLVRNLQSINEQIAGDQIIAPFDGVVVFVFAVNPGTMITGNVHMVTVVKEDSLHFFHDLVHSPLRTPEENRAIIRHGDIVPMSMVIMPDIRFTFDARVVNDPWVTGNRANMRYLFAPVDWEEVFEAFERYEVDLALPVPPSFVVEIVMTAADVLAIPRAAIRTVNDDSYVYLYENGYQRRQYVILGKICGETRGHYREIVAGLYEGQSVVVWR
jgi:hypothetical protein